MEPTKTDSSALDATIAQVNEAMGEHRWRDAMSIAEGALADGAENATLLWSAGWARFQLGLAADAIDYLRRAVDAEPTDAMMHWALGVAYREAGQEGPAELSMLRALALRDSALGRLSLANTYTGQGLVEVAEAVHREGLRLAPRSRKRLEALADFLSDQGREAEAAEQRAKATLEPDEAGSVPDDPALPR